MSKKPQVSGEKFEEFPDRSVKRTGRSVPSFLKTIRRADTLFHAVWCDEFFNVRPTDPVFSRKFLLELGAIFKFDLDNKIIPVLQQSLQSFIILKLNRQNFYEMCLRFVGAMASILNTESVLLFLPIPNGSVRCDTVIYDYEIVDPTPHDVLGGIKLQFKVMTGYSTGLVFWKFFRRKFLWKLTKDLGWNRRSKWSGHPGDLVMNAISIQLLYDEKRGLTFDQYKVESRHKSHNVKLRQERVKPCVRGYPWPCSKCPIGHDLETEGGCFRGTRAVSFPRRLCYYGEGVVHLSLAPRQPRHTGYFHPNDSSDKCMECRVGIPVRPPRQEQLNATKPDSVSQS